MKTILCLLFVILSMNVYSQNEDFSFVKDNIDPNKTNILDSRGHIIGYCLPDILDKKTINLFNKYDQIVAYLKPDPLNSEIINVYNVHNEFVSSLSNSGIKTGHLYSSGVQFKYGGQTDYSTNAYTTKNVNANGTQQGKRPPDISMKYPVSTDPNFNIYPTNDNKKLAVYDANGNHIGDYTQSPSGDFWVYFSIHKE